MSALRKLLASVDEDMPLVSSGAPLPEGEGLALLERDDVDDGIVVDRAIDRLLDRVGDLRRGNLRRVLAIAAEMLVGPLDGTTLEPTWLMRFLSLAQDVAQPELQTVWARVLAHEILRPGTASLRTLQRLAALDCDDLVRFARLARYVMKDFVVRLDPAFFEERRITPADFDQFEETGLIMSNEGRSKVFDSQEDESFVTYLPYRDSVIRVEHPCLQHKLTVPVHRMTRAGTELAWVMNVSEELEYMMKVTALFRRGGFRVTHASIIERGADLNQVRHRGFTEIVPFHP